MKASKKYIVSVIPIIPLNPFGTQIFSYASKQPIPKGSLVSIPFSRKTIQGITVPQESDTSKYKILKFIHEIIAPSLLTAQQIDLAFYISKTYFVSLASSVKLFIPRRVIIKKAPSTDTQKKRTRSVSLTPSQNSVFQHILSAVTQDSPKHTDKSFYISGPASCGKTELSIALSQHISNQKKQILFLVPDVMLAYISYGQFLQKIKNHDIALVSGKTSEGQLFDTWKKIKSGEISIIIGTKKALFLPYRNLRCIIVDEEHDVSYKQWNASPRYDARIVAKQLAKIHRAAILFQSATPSMCLYKKNDAMHFSLPPLQLSNKKPEIEIHIINMRLEAWEEKRKTKLPFNSMIFSKLLIQAIERSLQHKRQILLIANRKGMSQFSICQECKLVFKCPNCETALIYQLPGTLSCPRCSYTKGEFPRCPACASLQFRNIGFGTQKIEQVAKKIFPGAKIVRADSTSLQNVSAQETIVKNFTNGTIDILIGTPTIAKGWNIPKLETIGILDADNFLNFPDFNTDERALQTFFRACKQVGRTESAMRGKAYIQTYQPEHKLFPFLLQDNYFGFLDEEYENRALLRYPPSTIPILLSGTGTDQNSLQLESENIFQMILKLSKSEPTLHVLPPYNPIQLKLRGKFRKHILLRFSQPYEDTPVETHLRSTLEKMPRNWYADIHPVSLLT